MSNGVNVWVMCNVVWYDGTDAFVSKFILQYDRISEKVTEQSEGLVGQMTCGNGEVLKIDVLYAMDFENIVALKSCENAELESEKQLFAAYERFKEMWF